MRNPASAILSLAETLPDVTDPDERVRREQELIAASRKSARLADQLLSLERLRYGGAARSDPFDLNDVAEAVSADMAPAILDREVTFSLDRSEAPLPVAGDPTLVGEAIRNLIDNAFRHGGASLSNISVRTCRSGDIAELSVSDGGRGLASDEAVIAFRRFGQIEPSDGSGLGLSFDKAVATLHDGDVVIDESVAGAQLTLFLPLRDGPEAERSPSSASRL